MGNTTAGGVRGGGSIRGLDDDFNAVTVAGRSRPYAYPTTQDTIHGDDSVVTILTESTAIADHIRDRRKHMTGNPHDKAKMYVGTSGLDSVEEVAQSVPTVFKWEGGGKDVYISGTFNGWKSKIQMVRSSSKRNFYTIVDLPLGEHQYKFIVDGQWRTDQHQPITISQTGVQNNTIHVRESDFDVLTALSHDMANSRTANTTATPTGTSDDIPPTSTRGAARPHEVVAGTPDVAEVGLRPGPIASSGSPPGDYSRTIPTSPVGTSAGSGQSRSPASSAPPSTSGDGKKLSVPPLLPPQLLQVILNRDTSVQCDPNLLPQPDHVMVNHMYALSIKDGVIVLSAITRFRQKFVSTVLYKPI